MATADFSPTVIDITRKRNDTFALVFNLKDADGAVIDITGFTYRLSVDINPDPDTDDDQVFQIVGSVDDGPNGVVSFTPSAANANQLPDTYFYDVQQVDGASAVRTVAEGKWIVKEDITKDAT